MTGGDVAKILIALLLGVGAISIVAAAMNAGAGRICVECIIGATTLGVVLLSGMSVFRRYRQLSDGRCPNPLCHGVVQRSELVGKGNVVCPTCKKTWPELDSMKFKATARS
ncbi:MAG: hypothetical protein GF393_03510 [Armatimonadia bacterium]|nr:hypothetical protein [Armatimonadia bacterium]